MESNELLSSLSNLLDIKLEPINTKIDSIEDRFDSMKNRFDTLEDKVGSLEGKFGSLEGKFDILEDRFETLEGKVDTLDAKVDKNYETLTAKLHKNNLILENIVLPRLQTIEQCYLDTSKRYLEETQHIQQLRLDVEVMKSLLQQHSEKLNLIS